jgi:diaminohydroxyphosphoribosylaminopyrimidine deaminase/5-amino-6-(5-phosphoribosylamino)uracil reductase
MSSTSYMQAALAEAARGEGQTSPNPTVGAVVVNDGEVVGSGYHVYSAKKHAEIVALEAAGARAQGATVYVTLEPCSHTGRTPPCVEALIDAKVARVVVAMQDPNPLVAGTGLVRLRHAGIEVELDGDASGAAEKLNQPYIHFMRTGKPLVMLKAALTLDGKIAAPEDNRGWITSERARMHVQTLRHRADAIMTGIGTVLADNCLLTDRSGLERSRPLLRIVVDSLLRIPFESRMVQSAAADLLVVTTSAAAEERMKRLQGAGVQVLVLDGPGGRTDFGGIVAWLGEQKYCSLMIEAGSKVNWTALESKIVDKIYFYYAAKILGGMQSLPVAGGAGRMRRVDAMTFRDVTVHPIARDEFAVEAWMEK